MLLALPAGFYTVKMQYTGKMLINGEKKLGELHHLGGNPALDFANTLDRRLSPEPWEYLETYEDVIEWSRTASLIDGAHERRLMLKSRASPSRSRKAFRKAIVLREVIYRIFTAIAEQRRVARADLDELQALAIAARGAQALLEDHDEYAWRWRRPLSLETPLLMVAEHASTLLTQRDIATRVRVCSGRGCSWIFLDTSKAGRRRWCSMQSCGNRAKAARRT